MNRWQRLHIAVLDAIVDDGPMTADEIADRVDYRIDVHFSRPRVKAAVETLHRAHALIATQKRRDPELIYVVNTTQPKILRAVWRGESFVVDKPGADGTCYISGNNSDARQ